MTEVIEINWNEEMSKFSQCALFLVKRIWEKRPLNAQAVMNPCTLTAWVLKSIRENVPFSAHSNHFKNEKTIQLSI